jgi:hypothetical protein
LHLSNEIQKRLDDLNSNVKLATKFDGTFPNKYSFIQNGERRFRTEFAMTDNVYSIVLFECTYKFDYENCFARGLFTDINKLTIVIDLWVDKQKDIFEISDIFNELEIFVDFEVKNSNIEIDQAWTKVKNMFFNETEFWKQREWKKRYVEILSQAKRHKEFENYFPFTSHYWLRFSLDKEIMKTWILNIYIVPTYDRPEKDFYVSFSEKPMSGQFFGTVQKALDFYAEKLKENLPIKWDENSPIK